MSCGNPCGECYEVCLPACPDRIFIYSESLDPNEDFWIKATDKFGNVYWGDPANPAYGGVVVFDVSSYEHGLLNEHSGVWTLEFFTEQFCGERKELVFCGEVYECISVTFEKVVTENAEAVICCEEDVGYG